MNYLLCKPKILWGKLRAGEDEIHLFIFYLLIYLFIYLCVYLSIYLFICLLTTNIFWKTSNFKI